MKNIFFLLFAAVTALNANAFAQSPPPSTDVGVIGTPGTFVLRADAFVFINGNPDFADTELGIFDSSGNLLGENDGFFGSELTLNLDAGVYYLALGFNNSFFGDGFVINSNHPALLADAFDFYEVFIGDSYSDFGLEPDLVNNAAVYRFEVLAPVTDTISFTDSGSILLTSEGGSVSYNLPKFDTNLGTLIQVDVDVDATSFASAEIEGFFDPNEQDQITFTQSFNAYFGPLFLDSQDPLGGGPVALEVVVPSPPLGDPGSFVEVSTTFLYADSGTSETEPDVDISEFEAMFPGETVFSAIVIGEVSAFSSDPVDFVFGERYSAEASASITYTFIPSPVMLGDVNLDQTVDFSDIAPFIAVLSSGAFQAEADCDQDGDVDFADIAPFIAILSGP